MSHNVNELYPWEYYYDFPHPEFKHLHKREDKPAVQDTVPRVSVSPDIVNQIQELKHQVEQLTQTCTQLERKLNQQVSDTSSSTSQKFMYDENYNEIAQTLMELSCLLIGIMFNGRNNWITNNYECVMLLTLRFLYYRLFDSEKKLSFNFVDDIEGNKHSAFQMEYYDVFLSQLEDLYKYIDTTSANYISDDTRNKFKELIENTRKGLKIRAEKVLLEKVDAHDNLSGLTGITTDDIFFEYLAKLFEQRKPNTFES
jgi:hypothetical protein